MTITTVDHEARRCARAHSLVARLRRAVAAKLNLWRLRTRQRDELSRLAARDFADMGMTRMQARFEMSKPFWRA